MPFIAYPSSLENKTWQKAKSALAGETGVGDKLEELKKAHDEVENAAFEPKNGFKSKQEFDDWKKVVDPQLVKAAKLQKLLVAFSQFATGKAGELKKQKTCPSKTRELVEKMSAMSKKMALDIGVSMTDVSERIKNAEKALAATDDVPDTDLLAQLKAAKTSQRHFVIAMGKVPGLVLTKTGITGAHRQTAKELAGGGGKLIEGTVIFEAAKHVFVLDDKPPAGLARGIKKAIAIQTTTNVKVKVRGGGVDVDDEADVDESEPIAKVKPQGGKTPTPQSPPQSTKTTPPTGTASKTAPSGLSDGQELLSKLAINHGSMDSAAANKLLLNAPVGSWLLRYSSNQNQHIISKKTADGKFSHYFTVDKGKDLTLPELVSADHLDTSLVVRPGDKGHSSSSSSSSTAPDPALQNAHAKVRQLLELCAKSLTTVGPAFVGAIKTIQSTMQQALAETDATAVLSQFDLAKRQYLDIINNASKATIDPGKKAKVKAKLKKDVFFEKDSLGKATTPATLVSDPTYIAKVATTHGISETEAREVLNAMLDELVNETQALIPTGFVRPKGNDNTINPLAPEQSRPKLTLEEATAVYSYSTNDYQQINPPLWSNKIPPPPHDQTHKLMQEAFAKTKPFDVPLTVSRGMKFTPGPATDNFLKPYKDAAGTDTLIPLTGYISTGTTGTPSDFDGNIEFVILAKQALDLQPYSAFPKEKELLLNHNTPVKVHSCTLTGKKWTVTVEQILPLVTS